MSNPIASLPVEVINDPSMCAAKARYIYVTGGFANGLILNTCYRYDIEKDLWLEM